MSIADRRSTPRRHSTGDEPWSRLRLRAGRELTVVDASAGGLLVEGHVRLLPGTHLDVHLVTTGGRLLVRCRVVRAHVVRLDAGGIRYRGALALERPLEMPPEGYALPLPLEAESTALGTAHL